MGVKQWLGEVFANFVAYSEDAARHSSEFELHEAWRLPTAKEQPEGREPGRAD